MNTELIAVDIKFCTTYDFAQDGETKDQLLQRTNKYREKNISDYQAIVDGEYNMKNIGLLSYLPFGYQKAMEKVEREHKQSENNSIYSYFGEIGKRYKGLKVTLSVLTSYDTDYGMTHIYKMEDSENHVLTWKTGNSFELGKYIATMSVKDHKEYRGQKQTEVTRCKLVVA